MVKDTENPLSDKNKDKTPVPEEVKFEEVSAEEFFKAKQASDEAWRKLGKEPNPFE